jgi:nucleosome binding factor SPN SPT16 subunit
MLRERIMNEIKIVELERIRNRLKSYDIIFK